MSSVAVNGRLIRAVILDFGEVLTEAPNPETIASMAEMLNVDPERFRQLYSSHRYAYDRDDLSAEQYWNAVAKDAGMTLTPEQIETLRGTDIALWSNLQPAMLDWATRLQSYGLRTAVLSNMHLDMAEAVRAGRIGISGFDCTVLSCEVKLAKPDAEIYQHCLGCLQVAPVETLFVDDRQRNIAAAEALGILGLCANSPATIREKLQAEGWSAPVPA